MSAGGAGLGGGEEEEGDWAEQPRQTNRRTRNARRTIINRNRLNMSKRLIISWHEGSRGYSGCLVGTELAPVSPARQCETRRDASLRRIIFQAPEQLFGTQQLIHRAGAESLEVKSDEFESELFEHGGKLAGHLGGQSAGQFFRRNLDAHDFPVMAHAELPESQGPQCVFAPLDNVQRFGRNRASVFQARGKTGGGRLVPYPQIRLPCQFPD